MTAYDWRESADDEAAAKQIEADQQGQEPGPLAPLPADYFETEPF